MTDGPQAVILAGGQATRLGNRTRSLPKFLVPVAGRPFGAWVLDQLASCGISEVVLCIGHLGAAIRAFVADGARFGLRVRYSDDGPRLLGTAGALVLAKPLLAPTFLVTYGDSYLPFDYRAPLRDLEQHPGALGTLAVYRNDNRFDRSNVRVDGATVAEYRKTSPDQPADAELRDIDYGAMALRREALALIEAARPAGLERLQGALARQGLLRALRVERRFYEIGSEAGLAELDRELAAHPADYPNSGAGLEEST